MLDESNDSVRYIPQSGGHQWKTRYIKNIYVHTVHFHVHSIEFESNINCIRLLWGESTGELRIVIFSLLWGEGTSLTTYEVAQEVRPCTYITTDDGTIGVYGY